MTSEDKKHPIDEVRRFVTGVRDNGYECSYCGNNHFVALLDSRKDTSEEAFAGEFRFVPHPSATGYHDFVGVSCARCGNSNFFSFDTVKNWLETNPLMKED